MIRLKWCLIVCAVAVLPMPAAAQMPAMMAPQRTIVVSGEGMVSAAPNQATLSGGVVAQAATAEAALDANTQAMNRVFAALKAAGVPDDKVQTSDFSVQPQYQPYDQNNPQPQPPRIIGYQVSNQVSVTVTDLGRLGRTLDALVRSGANQLGGISFGIADPKPMQDTARKAAVADAMAKAKTLATAAGVTLGPLMSMSESGGTPPPMPYVMMRAQAADAAVPVAAGTQHVTVSVSMTYGIQ